jgi:hypothetical protein
MWLVNDIFRPVSGLILLSILTATCPFPSDDSGGMVRRACVQKTRQNHRIYRCGGSVGFGKQADTNFPFHCELTQHLKKRAQFSEAA